MVYCMDQSLWVRALDLRVLRFCGWSALGVANNV